jgi:hypothetical protein
MSEYGFDYFVSRRNVLVEMAAPDKSLEKIFANREDIKNKLLSIRANLNLKMKRGGFTNSEGEVVPGLPDNVRTNRVLRYIVYMLLGMGEDKNVDFEDDTNIEDFVKRNNEEIISKCADVLDIPSDENWRKYPYDDKSKIGIDLSDPDKLYRAATIKLIMDNPNLILSQDFERKILDPTNIANFVKPNRTAMHSGYSINKARELESFHGKSIKDIHASQMDIKDIVTKVNRAMYAKSMRKYPKALDTIETTSPDKHNNFMNNVLDILASLTDWIDIKSALDKIVGTNINLDHVDSEDVIEKIGYFNNQVLGGGLAATYMASLAFLPHDRTGNTLLDDLYEQFYDLKDDGISLEDFKKEIDDIKSYTPEESHPTLDLIVNDVMSQVPTEASQKSKEFAGFDEDVIQKFITTSEEKEAFKRYYVWLLKEMERNIEIKSAKLEKLKHGDDMSSAEMSDFRKNYAIFMSKVGKTAKNKSDKELSKYGLSPEDLESGDMDVQHHAEISKPYEQNESYVMNYMTEQVSKDRFKSHGEFKDRGFKKPMNYAHWLMIND